MVYGNGCGMRSWNRQLLCDSCNDPQYRGRAMVGPSQEFCGYQSLERSLVVYGHTFRGNTYLTLWDDYDHNAYLYLECHPWINLVLLKCR